MSYYTPYIHFLVLFVKDCWNTRHSEIIVNSEIRTKRTLFFIDSLLDKLVRLKDS